MDDLPQSYQSIPSFSALQAVCLRIALRIAKLSVAYEINVYEGTYTLIRERVAIQPIDSKLRLWLSMIHIHFLFPSLVMYGLKSLLSHNLSCYGDSVLNVKFQVWQCLSNITLQSVNIYVRAIMHNFRVGFCPDSREKIRIALNKNI